MQHLEELKHLLQPYFKISAGRLECLCHLIYGLLAVNDVNLTKLAKSFCSSTLIASSYKRMQRFLKESSFCFSWLWQLVETCLNLKGELHLALDRTHWQFGKCNINILTLAVCYRGVAIPFLWLMLNKKGNSAWQERELIIKKLLAIIPKERIASLLGDREFIGTQWLKTLLTHAIPFVMRTRENICLANANGLMLPAKLLFRGIKIGKCCILNKKRNIMGCELYIIVTRLPSYELLILLTDKAPELAGQRYRLRWEIESLFSALKKRGFNFENTHLSHADRISNLLFVMTITLLMGIRQGEFLHAEKPSPTKKHGYLAQAIFNRGLAHLGKLIFSLCININALCQAITAIFLPPTNPLVSPINSTVL